MYNVFQLYIVGPTTKVRFSRHMEMPNYLLFIDIYRGKLTSYDEKEEEMVDDTFFSYSLIQKKYFPL